MVWYANAQTELDYNKIQIINPEGKILGNNDHRMIGSEGEPLTYTNFNPTEKEKEAFFSEFSKDQTNYDPGQLPEGEYIHDIAYSTDGSKVFIANRQSLILTVFDATTMDTLRNIPVGHGAVSIDVNENNAVVACLFDNLITIIDLTDYSTVNVGTIDSPTYVKINPSGTHAYASNESGMCEVINLSTQSVEYTINPFPVFTEYISWTTGSGRNIVKYNSFIFADNGNYLVINDLENSELEFYNTSTNSLETALPIAGCRNLGVSPDGNTVYTTDENNNAYRINAATQTIIGNPVIIPDGARGGTKIISNEDGTKIYLGTNGNHGTLIDFVDEVAITYPSIYSAFWCDATYDHQYIVHGNYNFAIVNFDTETIEDVFSGYSQSIGKASPTDYEAIACDPLRFEGSFNYDFQTVSNIAMEGLYIPADGYE